MPIQYSTVSVPHERADFENFEDFWIAISHSSKPGKGVGCYDYGFNECTCFVGSVWILRLRDHRLWSVRQIGKDSNEETCKISLQLQQQVYFQVDHGREWIGLRRISGEPQVPIWEMNIEILSKLQRPSFIAKIVAAYVILAELLAFWYLLTSFWKMYS